MASNSHRKSGSSGRSGTRKRVVIGAKETVRVRYRHNEPEVESERRKGRNPRAGDSRSPSSSRAGKRLSNAKRDERERRQRTIRYRRMGLIGLAIAIVGLLVWGAVALYRAPIFMVEDVQVRGASHLSSAQVQEIADLPGEVGLLRLRVGEVADRLEANPWVAEATVERDFPSTLRLTVKERIPAAVVDAGGENVWLVSTDGYWLGRGTTNDGTRVVITDVEKPSPKAGASVAQPEVANAIRVLNGLSPELRKKIVSVSAGSVEETALKTKDDVEIFIGEGTSMKEKDRIVREILSEQEGVVYINVRVTDRPTWRGLEPDE